MSRSFQVLCLYQVGALGLLVAVASAISMEAKGVAGEKPKESLQLNLDAHAEPVRPGQFVTVPFAIKNVSSRQLLLAINQGDDGAHYAAKTLEIRLTKTLTGKSLRTSADCGCPVGEGFDKRHFYRLAREEELKGEIRAYWGGARQVPTNTERGDWRLRVQYVRAENMSPGQIDEAEAETLWKQVDVVFSNVAEIVLRVADWDDASTRALADRITRADPEGIRVAQVAKLAAVFPQVKETLFDFERFPVGHHFDFRRGAVSYLSVVPFDAAGPTLLQVLKTREFDGIYQVKYAAVYGFSAYPTEVVGPWLVKVFRRSRDDPRLQDKLLGALIQCKYRTDDAEVLAYMLDAVRSANADRFASSTSSYIMDACAALGVENTRPILEEIGRRLDEVRDEGRRGRLRQRLNEVLADK